MKKKSALKRLPKELTTITKTSRLLALILFFLLPILGFVIGVRYQRTISELEDIMRPTPRPELISPLPNTSKPQVACTMDAKMCADGSYVGRIAPACEFAACPTK